MKMSQKFAICVADMIEILRVYIKILRKRERKTLGAPIAFTHVLSVKYLLYL